MSMSVSSIIQSMVFEYCGALDRIKGLEHSLALNGPGADHRKKMYCVCADIKWQRWLVYKTLKRLFFNLMLIFDRMQYPRNPGSCICLLELLIAFSHQAMLDNQEDAGIVLLEDNLFFGFSSSHRLVQPCERNLPYVSLRSLPIPQWQFFIQTFGWNTVRESIDWVRHENAVVSLGPLENWPISLAHFAASSLDRGWERNRLTSTFEKMAEELVRPGKKFARHNK
jgi:hypothetical protein